MLDWVVILYRRDMTKSEIRGKCCVCKLPVSVVCAAGGIRKYTQIVAGENGSASMPTISDVLCMKILAAGIRGMLSASTCSGREHLCLYVRKE